MASVSPRDGASGHLARLPQLGSDLRGSRSTAARSSATSRALSETPDRQPPVQPAPRGKHLDLLASMQQQPPQQPASRGKRLDLLASMRQQPPEQPVPRGTRLDLLASKRRQPPEQPASRGKRLDLLTSKRQRTEAPRHTATPPDDQSGRIHPDTLLAIARLSAEMSIDEAAQHVGASEEAVRLYLSDAGLTPTGRSLVGSRAVEIDRLVHVRLESLHALAHERAVAATQEPMQEQDSASTISADTENLLGWLETELADVDFAAIESDYPDIPFDTLDYDPLNVPPWAEQPHEPSIQAEQGRRSTGALANAPVPGESHGLPTPSDDAASAVQSRATQPAQPAGTAQSSLVTPARLLSIAKLVATGESVRRASDRVGLHRGTVGEYLMRDGLRDKGRALVGADLATRIDELMSRNPGPMRSGAQMPSLRQRDLLTVARAVAEGQSLAAAAEDHGINRNTILHYLNPRGVTERGREVMHPRVTRMINQLIALGRFRTRTFVTRDQLRDAAAQIAAGHSIEVAAKAVGVNPTTIANLVKTKALLPRGRALLGRAEAKRIDAMLARRGEVRRARPTVIRRSTGTATVMTADRLWEIGARVAGGETIENAANPFGVKRQTVNSYLGATGLRLPGRTLLGEERSGQLDALFATRTAPASAVSRTPAMTAAILWEVGVGVAAGATITDAAEDADVRRQTVNTYLTANGLRPAGRALLGEARAKRLDELFAARTTHVSASGRRISVTPDILLQIAKRMTGPRAQTHTQASKSAGQNRGTIKTYLTSDGLTSLGRRLVGPAIARDIDSLFGELADSETSDSETARSDD